MHTQRQETAIYQGLCLATNFGCTYIICYSHSKGAIDILAKLLNKYILCIILDLMNLDWEVKLCLS